MPVYTIKKDDGLYHIATDVFGRLVTSSEIQVANNIPNADLIIEGQNLTIPLPCSCDSVNNQKVVHYAHVVAEGSTLEAIAQQFGTNTDTLVQLNGNGTLKAGTAIDVPLQGILLLRICLLFLFFLLLSASFCDKTLAVD